MDCNGITRNIGNVKADQNPMKAILCTRYGGPDDLELADLPDPIPGAGRSVVVASRPRR